MITSRPGAQVPAVDTAVPPLDDELAGLFEDLQGFGPGVDQILDGLRLIALQRHTTDSTQTHLAVLDGEGPSIATLLVWIVARLGNPDTNPALRALGPGQQEAVRELTSDYAQLTQETALSALISETTAVIDGH